MLYVSIVAAVSFELLNYSFSISNLQIEPHPIKIEGFE